MISERDGGDQEPRLVLGWAATRQHWQQGLLRDSTFLIGVTVVTSILGYAFWVVLARSVLPQPIGTATALIAAVSLASIFSQFGMGYHLVQQLPLEPHPRAQRNLVGRALSLSILTSLGASVGGLGILYAAEPNLRGAVSDPLIAGLFALTVVMNAVG
ncbi:MAG: oligosaccharide flippase family protein, partial [Acidimicrobiales bacterium]|nr:oligosaccharide flippase family protein [Acidimicrobiales bacterium]